MKEIEIDISKSQLVPKHRILSEKEREDILKKYKITLKQLPRILSSDPMVKLLDAKIGDVIEIERTSSLGGKTKYYRVVVRG